MRGTPVRGAALFGLVRSAQRFAVALEDPVLGRTIGHEYEVEVLPVVG